MLKSRKFKATLIALCIIVAINTASAFYPELILASKYISNAVAALTAFYVLAVAYEDGHKSNWTIIDVILRGGFGDNVAKLAAALVSLSMNETRNSREKTQENNE